MFKPTPHQLEVLATKARLAQAVTTLDRGACTGGWALPEHLPCPECAATSEGRCAYDEQDWMPHRADVAAEPAQADLFGGAK